MADGAASAHESRRTVTVVFADMVGFTALGERLDEESLRRVMDGFYREMRHAIEGEAGTLAKFIGDAVLAVWGTPEVREDDARRAVRAAEAMRGSLAALNEDLERRWAVRVGMRTGVNTGEVVVDPARPADLLVGNTLNVAARLEQAAADGEVLVGPETQRLVRDHALLEPVEPLPLKGKSRPLPAWRLVDGSRRDRRAVARIEAPLVGRDGELRRLVAAFEDAVASRSCRLVSVIGSPGLGKTRLVAELTRAVRGGATILEGRCQATGEGITFQPVAEVIRTAAGIDEDDAPGSARGKLEALLAEESADRDRVVDRAAALLGLAPATSNEETFWGVRLLLEAVARERPAVLVFEDIHWGEPTFLDLVEHLARWADDVPLLIVAVARPELRDVRPGLAEPGPTVTDAIALEPLPPGDSRTLVDRLLGASKLPPALVQRVLETAEGNPLFLAEMLRMLADDGVLTREGGTWVAAADSAGVTVPPTIQALLAARIERLGDDERGVVERASVIGHQFYRGAVADLTPAEGQERVDSALRTLQRKELVQPEEMLWLDERVFRFHHVLIRDAAYRSLLKEARADLHERFAAWLERKAGEHEETIAFHLEQAHLYRLELGPLDERGLSLGAAAGARLHSAGRRALEREDLPAAINLLRRALAPLAPERRPEVLVDLSEALLSAGDTMAAESVVEGLGLGADEAGDERLGAWATAFAGQLDNLTGAGHVRETAQAAAQAAAVLARVGDGAGEAKAHHVVAGAEALLGRVAAAEAALDRALVAARAAGDNRRVTAVLAGAPRAALWGPAPIVRASGRCLDVVRILRMTPGTRHVEAAALRCQAVLEAMRGRAGAARAIIAGCRSIFEELGLALELHETGVYSGIVELLDGEAAAAEAELRAAQSGFLALHVDGGAAQAAALLARALLDQGRDEEALEATRFAEARGGEDLKTTIVWLGARAEAVARSGALDEAQALAERAARLAEPTDALADKADALMALARVRVAAGDGEGAREAAGRARALYAEKDHTVGVAWAAELSGAAVPSVLAEDVDEERQAGRALEETDPGRMFLAFARAHAEGDPEAMAALLHDDFVHVEHRLLGWDVSNAEEMVAMMSSFHEIVPDGHIDVLHVYAQAPHVIAFTFAGRATSDGGAAELALGAIWEERDGLFVRQEVFEPDDREALMARFEELSTERELEETAIGRLLLDYVRTFNAHAWDAHRALLHDDFVTSDHRRMPSWTAQSPGEFVQIMQAWAEMSPTGHIAILRVLAQADRLLAVVVAGRGDFKGAGWELGFGLVVQEEAGRIVRLDGFEPEDDDAILACFEELNGGTPATRAVARYLDAMRGRDWEAVAGCFSPGFRNVDRRRIGWEEFDRDAIVATSTSLADVGEFDGSVRFLAARGDVVAHVITWKGTSNEGVEWERAIGTVNVGRETMVYGETFEPDDEAGMLARFAELTADGVRPVHPMVRVTAERVARAFNERRWEDLRATGADDVFMRDVRLMTAREFHGPDARLEHFKSMVEAGPGGRMSSDLLAGEELPGGLLIAAALSSYSADGLFEVPVGFVQVIRDGKTVRADILDDNPEIVLAHYDALKEELSAAFR